MKLAAFSIISYFYALYVITGWLLFQINCRDQSSFPTLLRTIFPFAIDQNISSQSNSNTGLNTTNFIRNVGLQLLWCIHHSTFPRKFIQKHLPPKAARSMFIFVAATILHLVLLQWSNHHLQNDTKFMFWLVEPRSTGYYIFCGLMALSWLSAVLCSFMIDHFELFGLKQGVLGITDFSDSFDTKGKWLYRVVRHPMMTGFLGVLCLSPIFITSYDRLVFSMMWIVYIAVGVHFEEKDLAEQFGEKYEEYCRNVPNPVVPFGCPLMAPPKKRIKGIMKVD